MEHWLSYIQRLQSIAQNGLTYSQNKYDLERFEELKEISEKMLADLIGKSITQIQNIFIHEHGYATPKVDVRGVIFKENKILLVKETIDGCWSLPGGWADIGFTPSEVVVKEVREEAGLHVRAAKLLAVLDKQRHAHPPDIHYIYKMFFLCEPVSGTLTPGMETSAVDYFPLDQLPKLSVSRNTEDQIKMLFAFRENKDKEIVFD
ncbi:putative ADP-ribose pyrophosphatase YjhB [Propionispora sp. 2/2-37]|uniref:NUDIX hydrolase n=1 Tax=Propionispora sp. 2/2-37 TaxID=1677858 RepID=UPI0006BB6BB2|nr:NUDIX hydrolase [Propionispora sp. 2/2-37]CUH95518.1 putative ADP-ribose pyrophosphatase YjhB [Propionispora sp. 2/2-37]